MKNLNKWLSILMALVVLMGMTAGAAAEEPTYTITINNSAAGHTYEAYQIFSGVYHEGTLANVTWGSGVTADAQTNLGLAAEKAENLKTSSDAEAFAKEVTAYLATAAGTASTGEGTSCEITGLPAGYYLVKDQNKSLSGSEETYTRYIVELVKDTTVEPKSAKPSFQKKLKDINDSTENNMSDWQDSADHDIDDDVPFQLMGTVPTDYEAYTVYEYIFHDKECAGLTFKPETVVVKVGESVIAADKYQVVTENLSDGCTFEIRFPDLKEISEVQANSVITVEYKSTLNNNAVIGSAGNPNEARLEFSNNPYCTGTGDNGETGITPWDKVIVFTYKTEINKVKENPNYKEGSTVEGEQEQYLPLPGAEFKLEKKSADAENAWKEITCATGEDGTKFSFVGIDDGIYRLTETKTPAGYNSIEPIYFEVTADHEILADNPVLTSISSKEGTLSGNDFTEGNLGVFVAVHNETDGSITSDILNLSGAVLPSTGGIGTTIFYAAGGVLVLAAVVLLITKRRMSNDD